MREEANVSEKQLIKKREILLHAKERNTLAWKGATLSRGSYYKRNGFILQQDLAYITESLLPWKLKNVSC